MEIVKHYAWSRVVLYYQTDPGNERTRELVASKLVAAGVQVEMQLRESKGTNAALDDFERLSNAKSNVFIFFGGLPYDSVQVAVMNSQMAPACMHPSNRVCTHSLYSHFQRSSQIAAGNGCFNDRTTRLVAARSEIAIICCCTCACLPSVLPVINRPFPRRLTFHDGPCGDLDFSGRHHECARCHVRSSASMHPEGTCCMCVRNFPGLTWMRRGTLLPI